VSITGITFAQVRKAPQRNARYVARNLQRTGDMHQGIRLTGWDSYTGVPAYKIHIGGQRQFFLLNQPLNGGLLRYSEMPGQLVKETKVGNVSGRKLSQRNEAE
jgi:hypothetical protein